MVQHRLPISTKSIYRILVECMKKKNLETGREVHRLVVTNGLESTTFWGSHLIRMFALCGSLLEANQVFTRLPEPSVFTWSAIILAHAKFGQGTHAIKLYHQMQGTSVKPDGHVFVAVLKASARIAALAQGKLIHRDIIEKGYELSVHIGSSLLDMYAKCGSLNDARRVFTRLPQQDGVTWNAMILGCVQHGLGQEALQLFQDMLQGGLEPDNVTFVIVLQACSTITGLDKGRLIHAHIVNRSCELDLYLGNSIIDMYAKCDSLDDAFSTFKRLSFRDAITWGAIITGCVQHGQCHTALQLFQQMQQEGMAADGPIFVCILKACSSIAALHQGKQIHAHLFEVHFQSGVSIGNTLIDMYAKCGNLEDSCKVFAKLPKQDLVTWNAIIGGCAHHSNYNLALQYFKNLQREGLKPDDVTFILILRACKKLGVVNEGCNQFSSMWQGYGVSPILDHHNCMVDLLGHTGHLKEAEDFLQTAPSGSDVVGWISLLSHCRIHGCVELGRRCFDHLISIDCKDAAGYVLMSQVYSRAGKQSDADRVEDLRKSANAWKKPGMAFIEIDQKVHDFLVLCTQHPQSVDIYAKIKRLILQMEEEGYRPVGGGHAHCVL